MATVAPADFFNKFAPKPVKANAPQLEEAIESSVSVPAATAPQHALAAPADTCAAESESTTPADGAVPAFASEPISKMDKQAERLRKAEAKEEERAIKEAQRQARDAAKAAKAAELGAERERKRAERLLREAAAEESRLAKKAEAERKEAERKAKLDEKECERERKVRELEIEREETERRAAEMERKRQKSSLFAVWGKKAPPGASAPATTANAPAEEASVPSPPKPAVPVVFLASPTAESPAGTILLRGGRRVRMYEPPDEFTRVAPPLAYHSRLDEAQIDELLSRGAAGARLELHGRRRRAGAARKRKRADRNVLQPWQLARYKFLKPDCDSVRPPYWGTWTKHSEAVCARRPLGRDARLDYEVQSEDDWEDEGEGEDLGSDDEVDEAEAERPRDADGAPDEDADGFVVADGYLSEDEQGHIEDGDGGPPRSVSAQQTRRAVRLVPHMVINLCPGALAPPALAEYAVKLAVNTPIQLEPAEPPPEVAAKPRANKSSLSAPETLALAEMVHGSADGIHPLAERFRAAHDGHSRVFVEARIREMAARTKRVTAAGDPYDAIAIWIVRAELAEGLGLDEPPPSRSRSGSKGVKCAIAKAVAGTPSLDQLLKKQSPPSSTTAEPAHSPGPKMQSQAVPAVEGTPARVQALPHPSPTDATPADASANAPAVDLALACPGAAAGHAGAGVAAAKSRAGSLNGFFLNRGATNPSPETGGGGTKTESRTVPAAGSTPLAVLQEPTAAVACRPTIGLAATDPFIAELMATGRPKPKPAQAATATPLPMAGKKAPNSGDQGAAALPPHVSHGAPAAEAAKPGLVPQGAPVIPPPPLPQDAPMATPEAQLSPPVAPAPAVAAEHAPDALPQRKRGRQVEALPPGWTAVEHTSKAGKKYVRYAGPKRAKAVSKAEAWRLHQHRALGAAPAALEASAGAGTDPASTAPCDEVASTDASEVADEDAGWPTAISAAAEAPLPVAPPAASMEAEPPVVCAPAPDEVPPSEMIVELPAALGVREAFSWAALEAKLRGDVGDAPNDALLQAWSVAGLAATPSEGVLRALVSSLGLAAVSATRRDVSLRCLGDSLIEWQKLHATADEADTNEPAALALGTYLLGLPDLAPNLLSCVGDPDLQLRKNAWRCANLLLTQRCPNYKSERAMPLAERVQAFGEVLATRTWVDVMAQHCKEPGRHAQYAAGTLLMLITPLGLGGALLATRSKLPWELAQTLASGIDKVATAKFCVLALVALAPQLGGGGEEMASLLHAAAKRVTVDYPKLESEARKLQELGEK